MTTSPSRAELTAIVKSHFSDRRDDSREMVAFLAIVVDLLEDDQNPYWFGIDQNMDAYCIVRLKKCNEEAKKLRDGVPSMSTAVFDFRRRPASEPWR
jgi:hypothetical protein